MGLLYDITKDYLYQEGLTKGREEMEESKRKIIVNMLANRKLSAEEVADIVGATVEYVKAVANELKK